MRYTPLVLVALAATALPTLASAQRVSADVRIGTGPVAGRIIVGDPIDRYPRRIVVVDARRYDRPQYREVVVARMHRGNGWWRNRGYHPITVWYDVDGDRYFDHGGRYRDGLREVVIYEQYGRYYDDDRGRDAGRRNDFRARDGRYDRHYHDNAHFHGDHDRD